MNALDAIVFTAPGLQKAEDRDGVRVWYTPEGDGVGLFYFAIAPDLPGDLDSLDNLRFYRWLRDEVPGGGIAAPALTWLLVVVVGLWSAGYIWRGLIQPFALILIGLQPTVPVGQLATAAAVVVSRSS
jgi:hypothetical protein